MDPPITVFNTNIKDLMNVPNKNKYGEVFTPVELIKEMLDQIPKHVWSNPYLTWLDPCAGVGNFSLFIFQRLMEDLEHFEPHKNKRAKHIIEKMLYMIELNPSNARKIREFFGKKANVFCGDFLSLQWSIKFDRQKYDVILGNPPWNDAKEAQRAGTNSGAKTLYDKFALYSLSVLTPNGYMGFIHPANWRGLGRFHHMWEILSKKQILYLHIYGKKQGFDIFDVNSRFDLYVLQNRDNMRKTKIIDEHNEQYRIDLSGLPFLPNYAFNKIMRLFTTEDKGIAVIHDNFYSTHKTNKIMNPEKTEEFKYPVMHTITKKGVTFHYTSDKNRGHFGIPKVILSFNEKQYTHEAQNDYKGDLGMSQICFGIPIKSKEEGVKIMKAVQTPLFKMLIDATKWSLYQTDYRMFKYLRPDFYKFFV